MVAAAVNVSIMDEQSNGREPFFRVYRTIRSELARGLRVPGSQIRVDETARTLGISPTPVREALAMLTGQGLVRGCRRQGYFVPQPSASDLIQLYILSEMHLLTAIRLQSQRRSADASRTAERPEAIEEHSGIARVFIAILAGAELPFLLDAGALILERLAAARLAENPELARQERDEILPLMEERRFSVLATAVRAYHRTRQANVVAIAKAIATASRPRDEYFRDMV